MYVNAVNYGHDILPEPDKKFKAQHVMTTQSPAFPVLGFPVHLCEDYATWVATRMQEGIGTHVVTLNAEMVMQGRQHDALAGVMRSAEVVIPDGAGVVLYLRSQGIRSRRCPGIELAAALIKMAADQGQPLFFYGGTPEVAAAAAAHWQQKFPNLNLTSQHGFIPPEQMPQLLDKLQKHQPRLILVGLGVPRQELWIAQHRHLCPHSTWIGVGGSFDIWAGVKSRAPKFLRENNLEWLYRLYKEPWRWRRMLALPKFAILAMLNRS